MIIINKPIEKTWNMIIGFAVCLVGISLAYEFIGNLWIYINKPENAYILIMSLEEKVLWGEELMHFRRVLLWVISGEVTLNALVLLFCKKQFVALGVLFGLFVALMIIMVTFNAEQYFWSNIKLVPAIMH